MADVRIDDAPEDYDCEGMIESDNVFGGWLECARPARWRMRCLDCPPDVANEYYCDSHLKDEMSSRRLTSQLPLFSSNGRSQIQPTVNYRPARECPINVSAATPEKK